MCSLNTKVKMLVTRSLYPYQLFLASFLCSPIYYFVRLLSCICISVTSRFLPVKVVVGWPDARPVFPTVSLSDAEFVELNIIDIDIEVLLSNVGRLS